MWDRIPNATLSAYVVPGPGDIRRYGMDRIHPVFFMLPWIMRELHEPAGVVKPLPVHLTAENVYLRKRPEKR